MKTHEIDLLGHWLRVISKDAVLQRHPSSFLGIIFLFVMKNYGYGMVLFA